MKKTPPRLNPVALDEFLESFKNIILHTTDLIDDPEGDWPPLVAFLSMRGGWPVAELKPIRPQDLNSDASKRGLAKAAELKAMRDGSVSYLQVFGAWVPPEPYYSEEEMERAPRPSENPDRVEVLVISEIRGDTGPHLHIAHVHRSATERPRLGPWIAKTDETWSAGGVFIDGIAPLIQAAYALSTAGNTP